MISQANPVKRVMFIVSVYHQVSSDNFSKSSPFVRVPFWQNSKTKGGYFYCFRWGWTSTACTVFTGRPFNIIVATCWYRNLIIDIKLQLIFHFQICNILFKK